MHARLWTASSPQHCCCVHEIHRPLLGDELAAEQDAKSVLRNAPLFPQLRAPPAQSCGLSCEARIVDSVRSWVKPRCWKAVFFIKPPVGRTDVEHVINTPEQLTQDRSFQRALPPGGLG